MRSLQELHDAVKLPLAKQIVDRMATHQEEVTLSFIADAAYLNSKDEWSMDDNFNTTEGIVATSQRVSVTGHPHDGNEEQEAWREIAMAFGYDRETLGIEPEPEDEADEEDPEC